jgi:hypothetical protein
MANDKPAVRLVPANAQVLTNLGLLQELAGTWEGEGFNLVARPAFHYKQNLFLELNQTREVLKIDPIGSSIPNRGFGQDDIELFGLTYLQKISDSVTGGALHIEPGIWVTQPATTYPSESAPAKGQIIARMGNIPHGNSMLAQGIAEPFSGTPVISPGATPVSGGSPAFSLFPSFNSTPFGAAPSPTINAAGSSEKLTAPALVPPAVPFAEYDLTVPESLTNPRTPLGNTPAIPLPANIDGVGMQDLINDPIKLLQQHITQQVKDGFTFDGTVLNIATQAKISFFQTPNSPTGSTVPVSPTNGAGGIENILFLEGGEPVGAQGPNADTALVYATFWIERVQHKDLPPFMQLQYAQMVILDFPIFTLLPKVVTLGWPHISVAILRKIFN